MDGNPDYNDDSDFYNQAKKPKLDGDSNHESFGAKLLEKMGYEKGKGLGRHQQGIAEPIGVDGSTTRLGFGHDSRKDTVNDPNIKWDSSVEVKNVEENPEFIEATEGAIEEIKKEFTDKWIVWGTPLDTLRDSIEYCDEKLVNGVIEGKAVFDNLQAWVINEARKRANPYETVMGGIFQNRAAMKTANLDRVYDWKLSREFDETKRKSKNPIILDEEQKNLDRNEKMFYFADVCAGPGGFSEYLIWRKAFYNVKGFGFTLRGNDDFKLQNFKAGSAALFETFYGSKKDGNVMDPDNLTALEEYVKMRTNNEGCHLVMCDGGFSVEGKEEIQEVMSKRLYLCQFIVGLSLARVGTDSEPGGNYLCKLFDVFTPFSAGLIYLMYCAFRRISLHKPNTSRPANSERYIFCEDLTEFGATFIKNYMVHINKELDKAPKDRTILEIVPYDLIKDNATFFDYFKQNNEDFANRQIIYLNKYKEFSRNKGAFDSDQGVLREDCLKYWEVPDKNRSKNEERGEPAAMARGTLLKKQHDFMDGRYSLFSTRGNEWAQVPKQVRVRELSAVLLPEHTPPKLLLSNKEGEAYIFHDRNNADKLEDLRLPPKTLLLAQDMTIYKKTSNKLEPYTGRTKMIFVVDAAMLSNDDISALPYNQRLAAIRKFCHAVNRGIKSIETDKLPQLNRKRNNRNDQVQQPTRKVLSYYLHCADAIELPNLKREFDKLSVEFYEVKCLQVALQKFEFPEDMQKDEDQDLYIPCQAVRFAQRYKAEYMICWSNSAGKFFPFNKTTRANEEEITTQMIASFYDNLPASVDRQNQVVRRETSWIWSWKMDSKSSYGPRDILGQNNFDGKMTAQSLCSEIQQRLFEYDERAINEVLP